MQTTTSFSYLIRTKNVDMIIIGQASEKKVYENLLGSKFTDKQVVQSNYFIGHGDVAWAVSCQDNAFTSLHYGMVPFWSREALHHYESPVEGSENPLSTSKKKRIILHPSFRRPIRENRCLIPVDYFIVSSMHDTPYLAFSAQNQAMAIAAVFDKWKEDYHQPDFYKGFTLLTEAAPESFRRHGIRRLPLVLSEKRFKLWLSNDLGLAEITQILGASQEKYLNAYPISTKLFNEQRNDKLICRPAGDLIRENQEQNNAVRALIRSFKSKRHPADESSFQLERMWKDDEV